MKNKNIFKVIFYKFILIFLLLNNNSIFAASDPYISGEIIAHLGFNKLSVKENDTIDEYNGVLEIEADLSLNINRNWSIKTMWQSRKVRDQSNIVNIYQPLFLSEDRQFSIDDHAIFIEELKINFENEDLVFFAGKYNPYFGNVWNKKRQSSIFSNVFGRDYQLREKIGLGVTALFEKSELSFYPFFNDNTDLSNSAIHRRGRNRREYDISGNNGSLSSYVIALSGKELPHLDDLTYHLAYKKLDVESQNLSEESGYVASFEYLFPISRRVSLVPFYEIVKTNNIRGRRNTDSIHQAVSLNFKYSSWNFSTSHFLKDANLEDNQNITDKYLEYNIGYKLTKDFRIDVSWIKADENGIKSNMFSTIMLYIKEF